jgi:hypothetical protein
MTEDLELFSGTKNKVNTIDGSESVRLKLRITSENDNIGSGSVPEGPSHDLPTFPVGAFCHAARVENDHIRRDSVRDNLVSLRNELPREGRGLGEIQLATESMDGHGLHKRKGERPSIVGTALLPDRHISLS